VKKGGCYNLDMKIEAPNFNKREAENDIKWTEGFREFIYKIRKDVIDAGGNEEAANAEVRAAVEKILQNKKAEEELDKTAKDIQAELSNVTKIDDWKAKKNGEDEL
jgi:hypothetical protein